MQGSGDDEHAWILNYGDGRINVTNVQPDGEAAAVFVSPEYDWLDPKPVDDMGIDVEDLLGLVGDERLNLPDRPRTRSKIGPAS